MKCDLFKNIDDVAADEIYSYKYVDYLIVKSIFFCNEKKCSADYISGCFEKKYGETIKLTKFKKYLADSYEKCGVNNYIISEKEKNIIEFIIAIKKKIEDLKCESDEYLFAELCNILKNENCDVINIYAYFSSLELIYASNLSIDIVLFKFYSMLCEKNLHSEYYNLKHTTVYSIDDNYNNFSIDYIIKEKLCIDILSINNINTIGQLKNACCDLIDLILMYDAGFYDYCQLFSTSLLESVQNIVGKYNMSLEDKEQQILAMRYGYAGVAPMTLEEIGQKFSVTRERIRQKEAKALRKVRKLAEDNKIILDVLFDRICNEIIIDLGDIESYINNTETSFVIFLLYRISCIGNCKYNADYNCLYNVNYDFDDTINEILKNIPIVLSKEQVKSLSGVQKRVFEKNYKEYRNVYIRKNMYLKNVFAYVISQNFPNGFRCSNGDDYNKLKSIITNYVGEIDDYPSTHSLSTMIERESSMVQCDRGTFINIDNVNELSDDLYQRIIDYIYENKPVIYYNTVFEKFKHELKNYDVNNQYLLKGLIDRRLPEDFYSKRDYISIGDKTACPYDTILDTIKSFKGVFSISDLRRNFPGVGDYVFYSILYHEKENGLIFFENKRFSYFDKLNISEVDKQKIKSIIDEMFKSLNSDVVSTRKVYARIKLLEGEYDLNLGMIEHYIDLYSVIKLLFPNDYYYSRTFISTNPNLSTSVEEILRNHFSNYNSFSSSDIKNYISRMNMRGLDSYLMFMDNMSDGFVQVEMDKMVKKDLLGINDEIIRNIKKIVNLLLNNFKNIDTRTFNGYSMFPKLKYNWNKYLLSGIIRTYLSDEFVIDYTDNTYKTTDFIIRRDYNE